MKHYGDITKLSGFDLEPVDVVTGGSPCQDLSVAGKRAGLAGERSGLFMEQVRIVKEMREHDRSAGRTGYLTRPRYMLWENVPGAFSSNKGEDFRAVLEEIAKVEQEDAHIPRPEGSWPYAGCVMGDGWSIAWRLHDAQFWGVPQRRKRIALVADFGGQSAPEILFERKGMRRDPEESGETREGAAADVKGSVAATISCLNDQGGSQMGVTEDVTGTLRAEEHGHQPVVFEPGAASRLGGYCYENMSGTLRADMGDNQPAVVYGISSYDSNAMKSSNPHSGIYEAETAGYDKLGTQEAANDMYVVQSMEVFHCTSEEEKVQTLKARDYKDPQVVAYGLDRASFNQGKNAKFDFSVDKEKVGAQTARGPGPVCTNYKADGAEGKGVAFATVGDHDGRPTDMTNLVQCESIVRRLTPLECERLQGFPDGWTDIGEWTDSKGKMRKCSDSARYKALGNSIAIPFWFYILRRMAAQYERPATLGSLFDGIGGFPLCWERCNGKGTAIWASEIEEFPDAVSRHHFPER